MCPRGIHTSGKIGRISDHALYILMNRNIYKEMFQSNERNLLLIYKDIIMVLWQTCPTCSEPTRFLKKLIKRGNNAVFKELDFVDTKLKMYIYNM